MISILLPTRGRLNGLLRVLNSVRETAFIVEGIKVLIKFDTDDEKTYNNWLDVRDEYEDFVRTFVWPRGRGYLDLYKYNNTLASLANPNKSAFYLVMNDDAYFTKKHWDNELYDHNVYWPQIIMDTAGLFPCINAAAYKAMGTFTKANHADTYLQTVGEQAGCLQTLDIGILHEAHKFEDVVRKEGQAVYGQEWEEQKRFVEEDVQRIKAYVP